MAEQTVCASTTRITLGNETLTAIEWAKRRGLKWQTVRMRRYRGEGWTEALSPGLRRNRWMSNMSMGR